MKELKKLNDIEFDYRPLEDYDLDLLFEELNEYETNNLSYHDAYSLFATIRDRDEKISKLEAKILELIKQINDNL